MRKKPLLYKSTLAKLPSEEITSLLFVVMFSKKIKESLILFPNS